jgi:hypothetical protein
MENPDVFWRDMTIFASARKGAAAHYHGFAE